MARPVRIDVAGTVEVVTQEPWGRFQGRHGDWGRKRGGLSLKELAAKAGGVDYKAVAQAVNRLAGRLPNERRLRAASQQVETELSNVKT